MATHNKTSDAKDTEMHEALKADEKTVPHQPDAPDAEIIDLADHVSPSFGTKIKSLLSNKKVLATAGGAVLGIVVAVVVKNRRSDNTEPAEEENASV